MTSRIDLYLSDYREIVPKLKGIDYVITDPPYPDQYTDDYQYYDGILEFLKDIKCRQLIFWTSKIDFPLDYSAIHIWDKKTGCGSEYERIFERNGQSNYKVFRNYLINSTVAANYTGDVLTGHKSQKPIGLLRKLVIYLSKPGDVILDPFAGSGTTGVACFQTGRNSILIEKNPSYYEIAKKRLDIIQAQPLLEGIT